MKLIFLVILLFLFGASSAFANCTGVYAPSEKDLDVESDVIFLAETVNILGKNAEGKSLINSDNGGFNPGTITFKIKKVFKGDVSAGHNVDIKFINGNGFSDFAGSLYFQKNIVAAKYQNSELISVKLFDEPCKTLEHISEHELEKYFASPWNKTKLKITLEYLKKKYLNFLWVVFVFAIPFILSGFAIALYLRKRKTLS